MYEVIIILQLVRMQYEVIITVLFFPLEVICEIDLYLFGFSLEYKVDFLILVWVSSLFAFF